MQPVQGRVRVDAELVGQPAPELAVGGQRLGLAAAPVEREHPLPAQPLAQRMGGDQPVQLAGHSGVVTAGQIGLHQVFDGGQPRLSQPGHLGLGE